VGYVTHVSSSAISSVASMFALVIRGFMPQTPSQWPAHHRKHGANGPKVSKTSRFARSPRQVLGRLFQLPAQAHSGWVEVDQIGLLRSCDSLRFPKGDLELSSSRIPPVPYPSCGHEA
jgi:hypothetical protein